MLLPDPLLLHSTPASLAALFFFKYTKLTPGPEPFQSLCLLARNAVFPGHCMACSYCSQVSTKLSQLLKESPLTSMSKIASHLYPASALFRLPRIYHSTQLDDLASCIYLFYVFPP